MLTRISHITEDLVPDELVEPQAQTSFRLALYLPDQWQDQVTGI